MKCPTCGAENDPANRFCDQCGSRIEPTGAPAPQAAVAEQPTMAAATCPNCHAPVLPGEAFCDECGAPLNNAAPSASAATADMPTMIAPPSGGSQPAGAEASTICPACGHQNLPGDRFCDNCGAALNAAPAPSITDAPTVGANDATMVSPAPEAAPPIPAPSATEEPASQSGHAPHEAPVPSEELTATPEVSAVEGPDAAPAEVPEEQPAQAPAQAAEAAVPAGDAQAAYDENRQRLQDEIARQEQIVAQFEQMQTMFGANTPPAVTQGLQDARDAKDRAQTELDALQPPAPAIDQAEVQRLQDEIARNEQIIAQFEQMQTMFGANTPPAVTQGLQDARDAKDRATASLTALTGGAPAAASPAPEAVGAPVPAADEAAPTATIPAAMDEVTSVPPLIPVPPAPEPAAAPAPAQTPAPAAARLVIENGGAELPLPADKTEIVIGREDPISGIFPEVDLTPHGGESGGVSRQHAKLHNNGGQWTITDLNSTNYTRVDGNKIEPNVAVPVQDGMRLQFGRIAAVFRA